MSNVILDVAKTIRSQIEDGVFMSLGGHEAIAIQEAERPGLRFKARILPFLKNGKRGSSARIMYITIILNDFDYYDIRVEYMSKTDSSIIQHFTMNNVSVFDLNSILLALDYDGPTVLNPRLA